MSPSTIVAKISASEPCPFIYGADFRISIPVDPLFNVAPAGRHELPLVSGADCYAEGWEAGEIITGNKSVIFPSTFRIPLPV